MFISVVNYACNSESWEMSTFLLITDMPMNALTLSERQDVGISPCINVFNKFNLLKMSAKYDNCANQISLR